MTPPFYGHLYITLQLSAATPQTYDWLKAGLLLICSLNDLFIMDDDIDLELLVLNRNEKGMAAWAHGPMGPLINNYSSLATWAHWPD